LGIRPKREDCACETAAMDCRVGLHRHRRSGQVSYQPQQPTEKLLILPLTVKSPADSAFSVAVMDVALRSSAGWRSTRSRSSPSRSCARLSGVGLPVRRAARRHAGQTSWADSLGEMPTRRDARAQRRHHHRDSPGAGYRQLGPGGALHGIVSNPGTAVSVGEQSRSASTPGPRGRAGARMRGPAEKEPVPEGARRRPQGAGDRAEPPGGAHLHCHRCMRRSTCRWTACSRPISAPRRATPSTPLRGEHRPHLQQKGDTLKASTPWSMSSRASRKTAAALGYRGAVRQQKRYERPRRSSTRGS